MPQVGWRIDRSKCVGCRACNVACKMENNTPTEMNYRWVVEKETGAYPNPAVEFLSMACYHCRDPACMAACPTTPNAITKDADGRVLIDEGVCVGCKNCMAVCPYGAPQFNALTQKVEKCTYCMQRTSQGLATACALTCVGGAITAVTDAQWDSATADDPDMIGPRRLTNPSVLFIRS